MALLSSDMGMGARTAARRVDCCSDLLFYYKYRELREMACAWLSWWRRVVGTVAELSSCCGCVYNNND